MLKIIKVVFLVSSRAPKNLNNKTYYINTDNYNVAHNKATEALEIHLKSKAKRFKVSYKELIRYFNKVIMNEIELIE